MENVAVVNQGLHRRDFMQAVDWFVVACALTLGYALVAHNLFDTPTSMAEAIGVVTALACVLITRMRNIWCWPLGIVSVVAMGYAFTFGEYPLMGQASLHILYYLPIQFWGWYNWVYGGEQKTELKVTALPKRSRFWWLATLVTLTAFIGTALIQVFGEDWGNFGLTYWDANIVAASVIAQYLLTTKKFEAWILWLIPVNVSAIILYSVTGFYAFAFLYVIFLFNALFGLRDWYRAYKENKT